jgi:hypothetical protein
VTWAEFFHAGQKPLAAAANERFFAAVEQRACELASALLKDFHTRFTGMRMHLA